MLAALLCALIYLALCCRICADVRVSVREGKLHVSVCLRIAGVNLLLDAAIEQKMSGSSLKAQTEILRRYGSLLRAGAGAVRVSLVEIGAHIGLGDAAGTAMATGLAHAAVSVLFAPTGQMHKARIAIRPDFARKGLDGHVHCIFSLVPGDIMFAVAKAAVKKTQREGFEWLSIPLRA